MRRSRSLATRAALVGLLCLCSFAAGLLLTGHSHAGRFDPYKKLTVFTKVLSYIENLYVENVSEGDLMYGAAQGLTDVLDPHSRFMNPEEYAALKRETEGETEIEGIGVDVEKQKRGLVIVSPIEGSPAAKAGVQPGDIIRKIDGVATDGLDWEEAVGRIKGPPGSSVVLVIERGEGEEKKELVFRITRDKFEVKILEAKLLDEGFGTIKLRIFAATAEAKLVEALDDLGKRSKAQGGLRGLVLDLRRNPGGLLDQGVRVADRFLESGLIVRTVGKAGREMDRQLAVPRGTYGGFPMVVLVDEATASAAEIVAGALQDHKRAVVMGMRTFGKGSVQNVMEIGACDPTPCGLKLTVARYYTPSGRSIQNQGIVPDVVVGAVAPPAAAEDESTAREGSFKRHLRNEQGDAPRARPRLPDHQLQTALDYLRSFALFQGQSGKRT
jgi:carboxyl-terminal processing protease